MTGELIRLVRRFGCGAVLVAVLFAWCGCARAEEPTKGVYLFAQGAEQLGYPSTIVGVGAMLTVRPLDHLELEADVNYSPSPKSGGPITFRETSIVTVGDAYLVLGPCRVGGGARWSFTKSEEGWAKGVVRPELGGGCVATLDEGVTLRLMGHRILSTYDNFNHLDGTRATGRLTVVMNRGLTLFTQGEMFWLRFDDSDKQRLSARSFAARMGVSWR